MVGAMTRNIRRTLIGGVLVLSATFGLAAPAMAGTSDCPSGSFCIWADTDYKTSGSGANHRKFVNYIPDYSGWSYANTAISANNSATSLYNRSAYSNPVYVYDGTYGNGTMWTISPLSGDNDLNRFLWFGDANNKISSGYFAAADPNH